MAEAERERELEAKLWDKLEDSPFVMLGLAGTRDSEARPMTAKLDGRRIWFFGSKSDDLVGRVEAPQPAFATFAAKGHDFFATITGRLVPETDPQVIDRLWDTATAAWYDHGREDPEVTLVRFDTDKADLWEASGGSLLKAAYHRVTGGDPVREVKEDQRAEVTL